ncbi:MAG: Gfo/Idh/MocA family oxidoreductase [Actinomycetota bacterium]|nr:Gfo/Idh/MocA family oxidoreductase [Actinomycetota bacterium]
MTGRDLRVGVVGAGIMGADHVRRISARTAGATVASVIEPDGDRAARVAAGAPGAQPRARVEDALERDDLDALIIASPGPFHEEAVLRALEAQVEILCEKPLTPTSDGSRRLVDAEVAGDRPRIQVGFMRRFDREYVALRQLVESRQAGELLLLHCAHRNPSTPPGYTESMLITDSVVHELDIVPWLAGSPVVSVEVLRTRRNRFAPQGVSEPQLVLLELANGVLAEIEISVNLGFGYQVTTEAVFEQGVAQMGRTAGLTVWSAGYAAVAEHPGYVSRFVEAYDLEVQAWVDAARQGRIGGPSAWDGYLAALASEAGVEAQRSGRRVAVRAEEKPSFYA